MSHFNEDLFKNPVTREIVELQDRAKKVSEKFMKINQDSPNAQNIGVLTEELRLLRSDVNKLYDDVVRYALYGIDELEKT